MGKGAPKTFERRQADAGERLLDAVVVLRRGDHGVDERLGQRPFDRKARVDGVERVLEHELRPLAEGAQAFALDAGERLAPEVDRAFAWLHELQKQATRGRLAAA